MPPVAGVGARSAVLRTGAKPPVVVLACKVLQTALARLLPPDLAETVTFLDYGLHRVPAKLTHALQEALDAIAAPSLVVLGYGLCGNGLRGLRAGPHTLLIPRTDDCIAILLGSYKMYMRQFGAVPGTYYLTKGWLESGSNPLQEYNEYVVKYGPKDAAWLMDQQYHHYERVVLVAPNHAEMDAYRGQAQEVARFCERWGWRYEEVLGSDDYVQRLIEAAAALGDHHQPPDWLNIACPAFPGTDFVVIPPGCEIRQEMFLR